MLLNQDQIEVQAARAGVVGLVGLSAYIGFNYWLERDPALAVVTLAAEAIAFVGLSIGARHWNGDRARAVGCFGMTVLAALWCGFTTWEKLADDGAAKALRLVTSSTEYREAHKALGVAQGALDAETGAHCVRSGPSGAPLPCWSAQETAWGAVHRSNLATYTALADSARNRVAALKPKETFDALAAARGFGIEIVKLFGLVCFAIGGVKLMPAPAPVEPIDPETARRIAGRLLNSCRKDRQPAY